MQAVIFCGIQGSGKTTFYAERFLKSHVRVSMDLMRTRHRERRFLQTCVETGQRFVVDNTNPTTAERRVYVAAALAAGFEVLGFQFESTPSAALERNALRAERERIPVAGVLGTHKRLQPLHRDEGYREICLVRIDSAGGFVVRPAPKVD